MLNWDNPLSPATANKSTEAAKPAAPVLQSYSVSNALSEARTAAPEPVKPVIAEPKPVVAASAIATEAKTGMLQEQMGVTGKVMTAFNANDKRVINGEGDVNQLAPFKYPWAWEYFLNANKNHWTPLDINMAQDVHDYNHTLTDAEKHVYENVLAYLTTSDILAMRNIGLAVMEKMTAPELQIYQARQVMKKHCIPGLTSTASRP